MPEPDLDVVAVGNAIVDVIGSADDAFLDREGLVKGTMRLIDAEEAERLYADMGPAVETSGGSAANTAVGVASLGGRAGFVGRVRDDQLGAVFAHDIRAAGVAYEVAPAPTGPPTARCLILVTPDAQRTMNTYLGASGQLDPSDVDPSFVARGRTCFLEGYQWDTPSAKAAMRRAMAAAKDAGRQVAFTLSDTFCVDRHRTEFLDLLDGTVDVVFANDHEARSLFETSSLDAAIDALRDRCRVAAVTCSAEGSIVVAGDRTIRVPAAPVDEVVDTTGAGDLYAAGFLFGLARGEALERCGALGSIAAAEVISHVGPRPAVPLSDLIREQAG